MTAVEGFWARELRLTRDVMWLERWRRVAERQYAAATSSKLRVPWSYQLHVSMVKPDGSTATLDVTAQPDVVKLAVERLFEFMLDAGPHFPEGNWKSTSENGWQRDDG